MYHECATVRGDVEAHQPREHLVSSRVRVRVRVRVKAHQPREHLSR